MFCIGEQTVCLHDGITIAFKNVVHKNNIVSLTVDDRLYEIHFLKGGEVVKIETMPLPLTGSKLSTMSE